MLTTRRTLITGLVSFLAAPAIVRAGSLMPVRRITDITDGNFFWPFTDAVVWDPLDDLKVYRNGEWVPLGWGGARLEDPHRKHLPF